MTLPAAGRAWDVKKVDDDDKGHDASAAAEAGERAGGRDPGASRHAAADRD